jgi:hypothetical protein
MRFRTIGMIVASTAVATLAASSTSVYAIAGVVSPPPPTVASFMLPPASAHTSQAALLALVDATPAVALNQTGYDAYVCGTQSNGMAIRSSATDDGTVLATVHNGDPLHVYATNSTQPDIPSGWALGYGRPGGGAAVDGFFKLAYTCT